MSPVAKIVTALLVAMSPARSAESPIPANTVRSAFGDKIGTFVCIDCSSRGTTIHDTALAGERLPPCSTFKIWNTLIGLEVGLLPSPGDPFYKWDGETRPIREWNRDLSLAEAFRASCVPAFQGLARQIGPDRMQTWIDAIGYGDRDTSAGIDAFWLPAKGRKTLLVSPREQAELMARLVREELPFSKASCAALEEIMGVRETDKGALYGKTGSGADESGRYNLGWFVGYVRGRKATCAFACAMRGASLAGKDARAVVERILEGGGLL